MVTATPITSMRDKEAEANTSRQRMTLQEFNALPDDPTIDRMLIRGELWEKSMTKRNKRHARIEARISQILGNFLDEQSVPIGEVFSGEAGCDLPDVETGVGIDVAVFSTETLTAQQADAPFIVGAPLLAVEILSPSERQEEIQAKTDLYLESGAMFVWIVDPHFQTVTVHRPDEKPAMYSGNDEMTGDPHLPGFHIRADQLFG